MQFLQPLLLVGALCLDSFVASFALGTEKIRIPSLSVFILSAVCSGVLAVSLFFGALLRPLLPPGVAAGVCCSILLALGVTRLLDSGIKRLIRRSRAGTADITFKFLSFAFLMRIYADNTQADRDHSKVLAPREALPLAIALSVDGLAAGFGAGVADVHAGGVVLLSFAVDMVLVLAGAVIGRTIAERTELNLSWLSGAVLIFLAISKLF